MPEKDKQNWFTRATLGAMMADAPSVATASGWVSNPDGTVSQAGQEEAGTKKLQKNLAVLGAEALGITGAGLTAANGVMPTLRSGFRGVMDTLDYLSPSHYTNKIAAKLAIRPIVAKNIGLLADTAVPAYTGAKDLIGSARGYFDASRRGDIDDKLKRGSDVAKSVLRLSADIGLAPLASEGLSLYRRAKNLRALKRAKVLGNYDDVARNLAVYNHGTGELGGVVDDVFDTGLSIVDDPSFSAQYMPAQNRIEVSRMNGHFDLSPEYADALMAHEGTHALLDPEKTGPRLRTDLAASGYGYYVPYAGNAFYDDFAPLVANNPLGSWAASPEEFVAETAYLRQLTGQNKPYLEMSPFYKKRFDKYLSKEFHITPEEASGIQGALSGNYAGGGKVNGGSSSVAVPAKVVGETVKRLAKKLAVASSDALSLVRAYKEGDHEKMANAAARTVQHMTPAQKRRAVELGMRASGAIGDPSEALFNYNEDIEIGGRNRDDVLKNDALYVATGIGSPTVNWYNGVVGDGHENVRPDIIDAVVHGKKVNPVIGRQLPSGDYGAEAEYMEKYFPGVDAQTIITEPPLVTTNQEGISSMGVFPASFNSTFLTSDPNFEIDNAGFALELGNRNDSLFVRGNDVYDFVSDTGTESDYRDMWVHDRTNDNNVLLDEVSRVVKPLVIRTPWVPFGQIGEIVNENLLTGYPIDKVREAYPDLKASGGKMYPGGGKFFRTNLQNESPLMYQPILPSVPQVPVPIKYEPEPNYGDYVYPTSTGMIQKYPIQTTFAPVVQDWSETVPDEVVDNAVDLFSDEARAERRLMQRYVESRYNDNAGSEAGAKGPWQIMDITLKDYLGRGRGKQGNIYDPEYNGGIRDWVMSIIPCDLGEFWSENDSDINKLAKLYAAYNWGAGNLKKFLRARLEAGLSNDDPYEWVEAIKNKGKRPDETKNYVKFLALNQDIPGTYMTREKFEKAAREHGYMADGGSIHIKPENRGKFTALKKRTGHSASWFKAHGTPAQKKMAVFALNSKHWSHKRADGGYLQDYGQSYELGGSMILPKMMMDKHSPDKLRKAIANVRARQKK